MILVADGNRFHSFFSIYHYFISSIYPPGSQVGLGLIANVFTQKNTFITLKAVLLLLFFFKLETPFKQNTGLFAMCPPLLKANKSIKNSVYKTFFLDRTVL